MTSTRPIHARAAPYFKNVSSKIFYNGPGTAQRKTTGAPLFDVNVMPIVKMQMFIWGSPRSVDRSHLHLSW